MKALSSQGTSGVEGHNREELVVEHEAQRQLADLAHGRFGEIPADLAGAHVVSVLRGAGWELKRAALEALAERYQAAREQGLQIIARPARSLLGHYRVAAEVAESRHDRPVVHDVVLIDTGPWHLSCGCEDFLRNSLAACKHSLAVVDAVCAVTRGGRTTIARPRAGIPKPMLTWDPVVPLAGPYDRLTRLRLRGASCGRVRGMQGGSPRRLVLSALPQRSTWLDYLRTAISEGAIQCEPAVATLIQEEAGRAQRAADMHEIASGLDSLLSSLKRTLYPYQREGVARFFTNGALLLGDDMGLGKTTQAIAIAHALFHSRTARRALVIVPTALRQQWLREWRQTTDVPAEIVDGSPPARCRRYRAYVEGAVVVGYEQMRRDIDVLRAAAFDFVVLDEGQRIKNADTLTARSVKTLTPTYRLVLTGTPMENRLGELVSIMEFVDDLALQPTWRVAAEHTKVEVDGNAGVSGLVALRALRRRLAPWMVRRRRPEVLSQLPPRTDTCVPVEMTVAQRMQHERLVPPLAALLEITKRRPLTRPEFLRLMEVFTTQRVICNGIAQLRFEEMWPDCEGRLPDESSLRSMDAPKLQAFRAVIEELVHTQGRKVVVFSQWRRMLRLAHWAIGDRLGAAGHRAVFFTGAESTRQRQRSLVEFHDDPRTRVMMLSDAGGVGLNLQYAATCCINLELPWNPAVLEQRVGRIYRLGQQQPIDVYNLISVGGIEGRIAARLEQKAAAFSALFDSTQDQILFQGQASFLGALRDLVEAAPNV